jgi:hypothetical protein
MTHDEEYRADWLVPDDRMANRTLPRVCAGIILAAIAYALYLTSR